MATTKKRINISVSDSVDKALATLAKRDQMPQATKVAELLGLALELEEDLYFSELARQRTHGKQKWVSHNEAWA